MAGRLDFDPREAPIALDANVFQASGAQGRAMRRLLDLVAEGELDGLLPHGVESELRHPHTPTDVLRQAATVRTVPAAPSSDLELSLGRRVAEVLQGDAAPGRHLADAANLVEAYRHTPVFVTTDRRLLKRRDLLAGVMPRLRIVSPAELVEAYDAARLQDEDWRSV